MLKYVRNVCSHVLLGCWFQLHVQFHNESIYHLFSPQYLFGLFSSASWQLFPMVEGFNSWPDVRLLGSLIATFRKGAAILSQTAGLPSSRKRRWPVFPVRGRGGEHQSVICCFKEDFSPEQVHCETRHWSKREGQPNGATQCFLCNLGILSGSQKRAILLPDELKTCPFYALEEHYACSNQLF